jgi:hypothetical protein
MHEGTIQVQRKRGALTTIVKNTLGQNEQGFYTFKYVVLLTIRMYNFTQIQTFKNGTECQQNHSYFMILIPDVSVAITIGVTHQFCAKILLFS